MARADPPLKGTGFRMEQKRECVKDREVDRQRGPGEAQAHGETLPSEQRATVSCVTDLRRLTCPHFMATQK